jgi:hypothetical protein
MFVLNPEFAIIKCDPKTVVVEMERGEDGIYKMKDASFSERIFW